MAAAVGRTVGNENKENVGGGGAGKRSLAQKATSIIGGALKLRKAPTARAPLGDITKNSTNRIAAPSQDEKDKDKDGMAKKKQKLIRPRPSASVSAPSLLAPRDASKEPSLAAAPPAVAVPPSAAPAPTAPAAAPAAAPAPSSAKLSYSSSSLLPPSSSHIEDDRMSTGSLSEMDSSADDGDMSVIYDADLEDKDNPQYVTEYISDIMAYFRKTEGRRCASPNYMSKQTDINSKMREILIDWLVEVHLKFQLREETLFLTINIIDRFLERRAVKRTKLQLVGCTAMLIASKYEEIYSPDVGDFIYISDKAYTKDQILAMEAIMLSTLKFNLTVPSSLRFAERYTKIAGAPHNKNLHVLVLYILESHLQKYQFLKYLPSMIAASATYLALKTLKGSAPGPVWEAKMVSVTQYSEAALEPCVRELSQILLTPSRYGAVRKKYSSDTYKAIAKLKIWSPDPEGDQPVRMEEESGASSAEVSMSSQPLSQPSQDKPVSKS